MASNVHDTIILLTSWAPDRWAVQPVIGVSLAQGQEGFHAQSKPCPVRYSEELNVSWYDYDCAYTTIAYVSTSAGNILELFVPDVTRQARLSRFMTEHMTEHVPTPCK